MFTSKPNSNFLYRCQLYEPPNITWKWIWTLWPMRRRDRFVRVLSDLWAEETDMNIPVLPHFWEEETYFVLSDFWDEETYLYSLTNERHIFTLTSEKRIFVHSDLREEEEYLYPVPYSRLTSRRTQKIERYGAFEQANKWNTNKDSQSRATAEAVRISSWPGVPPHSRLTSRRTQKIERYGASEQDRQRKKERRLGQEKTTNRRQKNAFFGPPERDREKHVILVQKLNQKGL